MNSITLYCIVLSLCCMVNAQRTCQQDTQCKSLFDCPSLLALAQNQNRTEQELNKLLQSHCGFIEKLPAVCCPNEVPLDRCYTPRGEVGRCISLYSCPALLNLLRPPISNEIINYLRNSKCSTEELMNVCCGPVPDLNQAQQRVCGKDLSAFPPNPTTQCCGVEATQSSRIFGGEETAVDQYPWMALIEYKKNTKVTTLCGGSLISNKYVLTAAHCVTGQILTVGTPYAVRLGEYDTSTAGADCTPIAGGGSDCTEGHISVLIEQTIPHPLYNSDGHLKNDIALIRMTQMVPFTDFIRPICLPHVDKTKETSPYNLTVAGWGATSTYQKSSPKKLHVQLPYVQVSQCQLAYNSKSRQLWGGQLCAGGEAGKDSCRGDSGGPLMYNNGATYDLIGIVSFGPTPCGEENFPGVYTHVYEYNTWIRTNITP